MNLYIKVTPLLFPPYKRGDLRGLELEIHLSNCGK